VWRENDKETVYLICRNRTPRRKYLWL